MTDLGYGKYFTFTAPYAGSYKITLHLRLSSGEVKSYSHTIDIIYNSLNRTNQTQPTEEEPYLALPPQRYYDLKYSILNISEEQLVFLLAVVSMIIASVALSLKPRRRRR